MPSLERAGNHVANVCRLTVRAPSRTIDLAVPADVPVADLLPALLGYGGDDLDESGVEHEGWVLQRLGGPPLDQESTLEAVGLHDGETLYLRPRTEQLPEVRLDDLVDGISTAMSRRPHGWNATASRRLLLAFAATALLGVLGVLAAPGGSPMLRAAAAGATGVLLLASAAAASRAVGDRAAAAMLGIMAGPFLALAGWLLPGGELSGPHAYPNLGARLLAACAAEAGSAVLALALVASLPALFMSTAVLALAGAVMAVLLIVAGFEPQNAAGVVALMAVVFGAFVPTLSFRVAGLKMPPLPTNAQQLQEGIEPRSPQVVAARTVLADDWMTSLYGAVGVTCAACLTVLTQGARLAQTLFIVALALLLLLHSRGLGNVWQRLSLAVPGAWGTVMLVVATYQAAGPSDRLLLASALLAGAATITIASWTVPGRRMVPYWGRAAELLHTFSAVSLLPLALWVLGVYSGLRAMAG
ncbi:type VII secretion integral membrane protein EccD [Streptomyces fuscichromogenes]|uniref:type VII secretion integral membrane protein EccD n=1 Tax=Streptomyces fuscichromogenes TaxID=1324013 RepID=UPI003823B08E